MAEPRQVGKTALVQRAVEALAPPTTFASADAPTLQGAGWLAQQRDAARFAAKEADKRGALLVLDEVQKIPDCSEQLKRLWDADTRRRYPLKVVVLLGSAPLLIARGLAESLGRHAISGEPGRQQFVRPVRAQAPKRNPTAP